MSIDIEHLEDLVEAAAGALKLRLGAEDAAAAATRMIQAQASAAKRAAEHVELAANRLVRVFGLSESEARCLWLLAALEVSLDARVLAERAGIRDGIRLDVLRSLVYGERISAAAFEELGATGTLRRCALIERTDAGAAEHESKQTWTISRRVLAVLHDQDRPDPSLASCISLPLSSRALEQLAVAPKSIENVRHAMRAENAWIVAAGSLGSGRRSLLLAAAAEAKVPILDIDARRLPTDEAGLRAHLKRLILECKLLERAPLVRHVDALVNERDATRLELVIGELTGAIPGRLFATCGTRPPALRSDRAAIIVHVGAPSSAQRAALWRAELGEGTEDDADFLSTQYPIAPALIHHAARAARVRAAGTAIKPDDIYAGIRSVLDDRLSTFARRVEVTQTWDDLVLPKDQLQTIADLIARIRQRRTVYEQWGFAAKVGKGLGLAALFSGPPGTGKTMVAGLIARDLGLELYQVDMAKISSKWIGETERNLAELFDAAEAGHAILLFDEADSLFGKRTEVKSSNDRYANLETNYLLQRLESFTGICLLTSNHESNIDPAFQRRLSLHVRLDIPDDHERERLWRAMLPESAPVSTVDFAGLARKFAMTGGYIKNAVLRAAFAAADEGSAIGNEHLWRAARAEYEAMGKLAL